MFKLPEKTNPFLISSRIVPIGTHIHTTTTHHCERYSWAELKRNISVKWNLPCGSLCVHARIAAPQLTWRTLWVFRWELYIFFGSANDKRTTIVRCSYVRLLKSRASFNGRKTILWMSRGCVALCKTVTVLTCEHLAKSWAFLAGTPHATYVCYTIIPQLPCAIIMTAISSAI